MENDGVLFLLALGPASAAGLYWMLYRFYRNTDKSHAFERDTEVVAEPVQGAKYDARVGNVLGTQERWIRGNNVGNFRQRVKRVQAP